MRLAPDFGRSAGLFNKLEKALQRIFPVALLRTEFFRFNDNLPRGVCSPACKAKQPFSNFRLQGPAVGDAETKLNRRGHLVDILAAGP